MCSDITKCKGEGCFLKETCHRYTSQSGDMQSYFFQPPFTTDEKGKQHCEMYWGVSQETTMRILNDIVNGKV